MINIITILITAISFEIATVILRYLLKFKSKKVIKKEAKILRFKKMLHFHHLFAGIIIAAIFYFKGNNLWFNIGIGIALSDLIHHFVILKILEKNEKFEFMEKIK